MFEKIKRFFRLEIQKYKDLYHYHKMRRHLKGGKRFITTMKFNPEIIDYDTLANLVVKEVKSQSDKYDLELNGTFETGFVNDDFIKGFKTLKIEYSYECPQS